MGVFKAWVGLRVKGFSTPCVISYVVSTCSLPYGDRGEEEDLVIGNGNLWEVIGIDIGKRVKERRSE